ncbi:DUF3467 domain-containing protein [Capnocytophaga sp. ARDL2]|uniref:DUF3467 domain-containing protein n=1 Tax=Capnocytophaga sp. ARDL2 TaxID=3238809 RepID=UPI003557177F
MNEEKKRIQVDVEPEATLGKYSNLVIVNHSTHEFVLDFASLLPGVANAKIHSRLILAPTQAKQLLKALEENIKRYNQNTNSKEIVKEVYQLPFEPKGEA